jgi:hypothetical protein
LQQGWKAKQNKTRLNLPARHNPKHGIIAKTKKNKLY